MIAVAERVFKFNDNTLPDPDPTMSEEDVLDFYSGRYPELTAGFVQNRKQTENGLELEIGFNVGDKG